MHATDLTSYLSFIVSYAPLNAHMQVQWGKKNRLGFFWAAGNLSCDKNVHVEMGARWRSVPVAES